MMRTCVRRFIPLPAAGIAVSGKFCVLALLLNWLLVADATAYAAPRTDGADWGEAIQWPDVPLRTSENQEVKLQSHVIANRLVVMNFVYANCTTACPIQLALFARLQQRLGTQLEDRVRLVSISVDPATDVPERLKNAALRYGAKPGWIWLTGPPSSIGETLRSIGANSADPTRHAPLTLVGDGRCNRWLRYNGFVAVDRMLATLEARRSGNACQQP